LKARPRFALLCAVATIGATGIVSPANAEDGVFSFQIENDAPMRDDRHYTSGLRFAWLTEPLEAERGSAWAGALLPFTDPGASVRFDFVLGQNLFTPRQPSDPIPAAGDRPFAGWLYLNAGLVAETGTVRDQLYAGIGITGPAALGRETQELIHDNDVAAWRFQLEGEPTLEIQYQRTWRVWRSDGWLDADLLPKAGFALGTAHIFANAGLMARIGFNLPRDFGPSLGDPGLMGSTPFASDDGFAFYLFAALDARAVAHNMFLDGGTFRDGPSVGSRTFTGDAQLGFVALWSGVRVTGSYVFRGDDFRGQVGDDAFASLTLSFQL
jgi:hypothetical protein